MNMAVSESWSTPGSLLIAGEYLVTEEQGIGVALAAGGRACLNFTSSPSRENCWLMEGHWPSGGERWMSGAGKSSSPISAVWKECQGSPEEWVNPSKPRMYTITVNTSNFYTVSGQKRGYGSSAAAILLFTRGLLESPKESIVKHALAAHRYWQGGLGSGYDVLTSAYGGAGKFIGGKSPDWDALNWPGELNACLVKGEKTVHSPDAVAVFQRWKLEQPRKYACLKSGMSNDILSFSGLLKKTLHPDPEIILEKIHTLADYGMSLGSHIGISAIPKIPGEPQLPMYRKGALCLKCLGAGNETILLLSLPDGLSSREKRTLEMMKTKGLASPLRVEYEGLKLEKI